MSRVLVLGATGSLGGHVLRLGGHAVTAFVRTPSKLPEELRTRASVSAGNLDEGVPLDLIRGHDAVINCAGHVKDGERFVRLVDGIVTCVGGPPRG
jgi:putative NADH-flavin reductase